ncbi:hypothetical protein AM305_05579 [Actinobacillus minor NM305]|uniref:Uncharacterized protein n=1 Tax=Actinobacillus minor NM305 TaxID=637911 RepID=C5RZM3_9PAST|nr:WlaTC/HtrL family glycosyltransferase [Actinobacillus minor]EER47878.1 hypothetical protein AM305_05579 [Actinobacillus minor NM305]MDY5106441.1 WlaTC/HtrL family glycosyltransferase [Actinobacillus minor]
MTKEITIVTAFFDIGRGNISTEAGYPSYLIRSNNTYFSYFVHLAKLEKGGWFSMFKRFSVSQ